MSKHTHCKTCKRPFTKVQLAERKAERRRNALNSIAKAKASGKFFKRKRKLDRGVARSLYEKGSDPSFIAELCGVNVSTVYKALKENP